MKISIVTCVVALVLQAMVVHASEVEGALVRPLPNGDVELENVGSAFASRLQVVELSTNEGYRVVCQVFYYDESLPTDDAEIELKDRLVNQALKMYLGSFCEDRSAEELVDDYRSGLVNCHLDGFRRWAQERMFDIGIDVVGVAMRATGALRRRVSK